MHGSRGMGCFSLISCYAWRLIFEPLLAGFRNDVVAILGCTLAIPDGTTNHKTGPAGKVWYIL